MQRFLLIRRTLKLEIPAPQIQKIRKIKEDLIFLKLNISEESNSANSAHFEVRNSGASKYREIFVLKLFYFLIFLSRRVLIFLKI